MTGDDAVVRAEFFELLLSTKGIEEFLAELVASAARTVDCDLSATITTRRDRRPATAAASNEFASGLDELQYADGAGPCLQAMETGQRIEITDLAAEHDRWGSYGSQALAHGLAACLSMPMIAAGTTWGALNLYSPIAESFTDTDRARAEQIAAQAATALAIADRLAEQTELSEQLHTALESRAVIDQAIGIIMGAQHCDAETAFGVIRAASQHRNLKLRDIAARIVADTIRGQPAPPVP